MDDRVMQPNPKQALVMILQKVFVLPTLPYPEKDKHTADRFLAVHMYLCEAGRSCGFSLCARQQLGLVGTGSVVSLMMIDSMEGRSPFDTAPA